MSLRPYIYSVSITAVLLAAPAIAQNATETISPAQAEAIMKALSRVTVSVEALNQRIDQLEARQSPTPTVPPAAKAPAETAKPVEDQNAAEPQMRPGSIWTVFPATYANDELKSGGPIGAMWMPSFDDITFSEHKRVRSDEIKDLSKVAYRIEGFIRPKTDGEHTILLALDYNASRGAPPMACRARLSADSVKIDTGTVQITRFKSAPSPETDVLNLTAAAPTKVTVTASCVVARDPTAGDPKFTSLPVSLRLALRAPGASSPEPLGSFLVTPIDEAAAAGAPPLPAPKKGGKS